MPTQLTNYQCPACTGPLRFAGDSGKLECEYCGAGYDVAEIEALYARKEEKAAAAGQSRPSPDGDMWDSSGFSEDWGAEGDGMRAYSCPSCGAELICDENTAATSCPYCGNPTVVPGQFSGQLRPDFIIPFKLNKEDAVKALKNHYKGKIFLPKSFTRENHVQEIQGIYVPFWMFDGRAQGDAHYVATRVSVYETSDEEVTETEYFDIYRAGSVDFEKIPVDASGKMPDGHMESIEPYDYSELRALSTAYLPGFLADRFDVTVEQCLSRADLRCRGSLISALGSTIKHYDSCTLKDSNIRLERGKVHYGLMPVWMLNTRWKGKDFLFAMNGQTGKLVGDLPIHWGKFWGLFAAIAVPLSILGSALAFVLALLLALSLCTPAPALAEGGTEAAGQSGSAMQYVFDIADCLSYAEWEALEARASEISRTRDCGVYFALLDDYRDYGEGSVYELTYQLYHNSRLGIGGGRDGIIVLLSMAERDYAMFVYGEYAQYAFDEFGQEKLEERFLEDLGSNDWYSGISHYLDGCDEFLTKAENGKPVRLSNWGWYGLMTLLSCLLAGAVCSLLMRGMKTVGTSSEADAYVSTEGLILTGQSDHFSHSEVTRRKIQKESSSGSSESGGGGSGRSGKF